MGQQNISQRKSDHLTIAREGDVLFHNNSTLLEEVGLVHEALPDLSLDDIDLSTTVLGRPMKLPLFIAAMTGGSAEAAQINRTLAEVAQQRGCGFGLGSQRAMLLDESMTSTFEIRHEAKDVLVLGNLGVVQARQMSTEAIAGLAERVGADAICIHMNTAMEVVQPEGDRDFSGGLRTFERLVRELPLPVIAKETGCGISYATARRLAGVGVTNVDVSGAGGTSWVAVELHRASDQKRGLGQLLREWGIPTAASVSACVAAGMDLVIATGGIKTGLDIARAIVLGAHAAGIARPMLLALKDGGAPGVHRFIDQVEAELRSVMLLVGARNLTELRLVPRMVGPRLRQWQSLEQAGYNPDSAEAPGSSGAL